MSRVIVPMLLLACALPLSAEEKDWHFTAAPYLWAAGLDGSTRVGPVSADLDVSFGDIVDALEGGILLHVEGEADRWGFMCDFLYLALEEGVDFGPVGVNAKVSEAILEAAAMYKINEQLRVLGGVRYVNLEVELDVQAGPLAGETNGQPDWTDVFVGARWEFPLSEKWGIRLRGDIGGFGLGDSSDFSWQFVGLLTYEPSTRFVWGFGYRILDIDYEDGPFEYDVRTGGVEAGVGYRF